MNGPHVGWMRGAMKLTPVVFVAILCASLAAPAQGVDRAQPSARHEARLNKN